MTKKCPECQDTGIIDEQPTISYEWDAERGAEEIVYSTECQCVYCSHAWREERRGNYRIVGEVLDEQRAKLDLLWAFYEVVEGTVMPGLINDLMDKLEDLWDLRQYAIKVAAERKEMNSR